MIFAGFQATTLLGIFATVAAIATALYALKLRRRTVAVPFAKLWAIAARDHDATRLFSRLKRFWSWLFQLVILALLVLALGDPRAVNSVHVGGRNIVVLVDASASMQALDGAPTRLDSAKKQVETMIRGLGGADRMLIAQMEARVTPLGAMTANQAALTHSLGALSATDTRANLTEALRFASDSLRGLPNPEICVVSDGRLTGNRAVNDDSLPVAPAAATLEPGIRLTYVPIGTSANNIGITAFSVRRYPVDKNHYEVMLEVVNTGSEPVLAELSLFGDGEQIELTNLKLAPGERLSRFYPNLSGARRMLEATLKAVNVEQNALPADDHAYALLPERRRVRARVVSKGNTYLEAALLLDDSLEVAYVSPADAREETKKEAADIVIYDSVLPVSPPHVPALYLNPPRGAAGVLPIRVGEEIRQPGFDKLERNHAMVRWTALDDVNITRGVKLFPERGDTVVGASEAGALLVAGEREGVKFAVMGFDVRESDLPLRVAWPLVVLNTLEWFSGNDASYVAGLRTGEIWRVPTGVAADGYALVARSGGAETRAAVIAGYATYVGEKAGFYALYQGDTGGAGARGDGRPQVASWAANLFDSEESAIQPAKELVVDGRTALPPEVATAPARVDIWVYLALAVVILAVLEWVFYHRRITV